MEENNNNENNNHVHYHEKHCWKKCLAMLIAAFLGAFLAFYFVTDQMMKRYHFHHFNPERFEKRMFDDLERSYKIDRKNFDKMLKRQEKMLKLNRENLALPFFITEAVKITTDFADNNFNIIIDSKAFKNNENDVNYKVDNRKLTVFGSTVVKDKDFEQDVAFSQDFILPTNADTENISKDKDDKRIIITVPLKKEFDND